MTPERQQYLASISKEERAIRELIENRKRTIKHYKILMNEDKEDTEYINDIGKPQIAETKILIKALKKQLPAPKKEIDIGLYWAIFNCPICRTTIPIHSGYCLCCGNKMR